MAACLYLAHNWQQSLPPKTFSLSFRRLSDGSHVRTVLPARSAPWGVHCCESRQLSSRTRTLSSPSIYKAVLYVDPMTFWERTATYISIQLSPLHSMKHIPLIRMPAFHTALTGWYTSSLSHARCSVDCCCRAKRGNISSWYWEEKQTNPACWILRSSV